MPELSISEDQRAYIESLRAELSEDVGPYGHVRPRDALQFLIDSHEESGGLSVGAVVEESESGTGEDEEGDANDEESEEDEASDEENGTDGSDENTDEDDADRLSSMMSLLDEHDGKWRRIEDEGTYEVDVPDGDTETVRTKDEVRAVLFKQY